MLYIEFIEISAWLLAFSIILIRVRCYVKGCHYVPTVKYAVYCCLFLCKRWMGTDAVGKIRKGQGC